MSEYDELRRVLMTRKCIPCNGSGECNDADTGDIRFNKWMCTDCNGTGLKPEAKLQKSDTDRLDFVLEHSAFIVDHMRDDTFKQYQLWTQDEDENFIKLSGDSGYFNSPREAIDAAMRLHQTTGGQS